MKKTILSLGLTLFAANQLMAFEMCGENPDLDRNFKVAKDWNMKEVKEKGVDVIEYEKIKGFSTCQVQVNKETNKISKLTKLLTIKAPLTPPKTLDSMSFKSGFVLHTNSHNQNVQKESADFDEFTAQFKTGISKLKISKVNYSNDNKVATVNTICKISGKDCKSIIEISKPFLSNAENQKNHSKLNRFLNKVVEQQNLKLKKTEGWQ